MENSSQKLYSVLGIGNPSIDIIGAVNDGDIVTYSLIPDKTVNADDSNIKFVEKFEENQLSKDLKYLPGGSAINTIKVINWLTHKEYIPRPGIIGCIGSDRYGQLLRLYLNQRKIKYLLQEMADLKTSRCIIGVSKSNKIHRVNQIRASVLLDKKYVEKKLDKILSSDMLFIEGYFILGKYDIISYLLTLYDDNSRKIAFNVSAAFICSKKQTELKNIFNHSDFIFASEEEIQTFLGSTIENPVELSTAFHQSLSETFKMRNLVLMRGEEYFLITTFDHSNNTFIKEYEYNSNKAKKGTDMSCTREASIGGFLAGVIRNRPWKECVEFALFAFDEVKNNISCSFKYDNYKD